MAWPLIVLCMVLSLCVVSCVLNHAGNTSASALKNFLLEASSLNQIVIEKDFSEVAFLCEKK